MRRLASLLFLLSFVATAAHAQTLVLSQNKCALDKQDQVRRLADSLWMPVAQELVNEGKLTSVGSAYHAWGDEWNVIIWYIAPTINAFNTGFNDLVTRINQRHPTLFPQFGAWCSEHKDSIYTMGRTTTAPAAATAPRRE
jgi:hypothetical protein